MKLTNEQLEFYSEQGYLLFKNIIPKANLDALLASLTAMARKSTGNNTKTLQEMLFELEAEDHSLVYTIHKAAGTSAAALKLLSDLALNEIHAQLYSVPPENIHSHLFQAPCQFPADDKFNFSWHQESSGYDSDQSPILTCWFPILGDVNAERGSVEMIPGSQKKGMREFTHHVYESGLNDWVVEVTNEEESKSLIAEMKPGDVLVFDSDVIHRSVPNRSSDIRITGISRTLDICSRPEIAMMANSVDYMGTKNKIAESKG